MHSYSDASLTIQPRLKPEVPLYPGHYYDMELYWDLTKQSLFIKLKTFKMVQVIGYKEVAKKDGSSFIALELSGDLELVQSSTTGAFYATTRKCRIPSTFDANVAKVMIGKQIDGDIVRVSTQPYEYTSPKTGEVLTLQHSYAYRPAGSLELIGHTPVRDLEEA